MLYAVQHLRDLEHCRSLQSKNSEEIKVFHAHRSVSCGENDSFYAFMLSVDGDPALNDVANKFPAVDNESIRDIWKKRKSWGECFDVLNALQAAEEAKRVVVADCAFLVDSISWPALRVGETETKHNSNWVISEILSLSDVLSQLSIDSANNLESWELLQRSSSDEGAEARDASTGGATAVDGVSQRPMTRGTVRNYREALLKTSGVTSDVVIDQENARKRATKAVWKPAAIVVKDMKYEHKDKLYVHNLIEKGIDPNALPEVEEDDGYDGGSFFQSSEFAKGMVSVNRQRAATMLRPAALEKKMARIAHREALRPPVPGSQRAVGASVPGSKWSAAPAESEGEYTD